MTIDDRPLLLERSTASDQLVEVAEHWMIRMAKIGWRSVTPAEHFDSLPNGHHPA